MSGLCGWFGAGGGASMLPAMSAHLTRFDSADLSVASDASGGVAASGGPGAASTCRDGVRLAAVWGRPRFADAALERLSQAEGAALALARGYGAAGSALLESLSGHFALAVADGGRVEALLATDRMGVQPLYWREAGGLLLFASTLDALAAGAPGALEPDSQSIYDFLYFHVVPGPATIYRGCRRLLPGHCLERRDGQSRERRYWSPRFEEGRARPFGELKEAFVGALTDSVKDATSGAARAGAFLSGGTDSSTLAGLLGRVSGAPALTYSIGFGEEGYDESEYARIAARHFGTRHHEYYVTPEDVVGAVPKIAAVHDQPFGNSSAVPAYFCAKLAREDGVDLLLGGDGGDELFGGNVRYAKQYLYSLYSDLPQGLRRGLIEPLAFALKAESGPLGKVQRYMRNACVPMPARYDNYNLLERLGPASVFDPAFLEQVDPRRPAAQMATLWEDTQARSLINRMLALDFKYTLADNDLPKVMRSCELAGVEVRFPMLAQAVVDFSLSLPPDLKLRRTRLRWFFKEALRDFLPAQVIAKQKHGFGLPFGVWMRSHPGLEQLVKDNLSGLRRRGIVRPAFLDELLDARVAEHAAYYGTMAWILMMLELWFQRAPALRRA